VDLLDRLRLDVPVAQAGMGGGPAGPMFSPVAPTVGMPDSAVDRTALYAGESVLRMTSVISARQAVTDLTPK